MAVKIDCIIVEDEPLALERTRNYVMKLPYLNLIGNFDNGIDALVFLKANHVDLVFLDINMGDFSGIQLLESSNITSRVIITTAYQEYALKGYELNVTDYLMKPFTLERFVQAVDRAQMTLGTSDVSTEIKYVFVKTEYRLEKVLLADLLYIEGMRDYRRVHTSTKKIMTLQTFKDFELLIPGNFLCRVHKSYMVAIEKIDSVERDRIKIGDAILPISDTYRQNFFEQINRPIKDL